MDNVPYYMRSENSENPRSYLNGNPSYDRNDWAIFNRIRNNNVARNDTEDEYPNSREIFSPYFDNSASNINISNVNIISSKENWSDFPVQQYRQSSFLSDPPYLSNQPAVSAQNLQPPFPQFNESRTVSEARQYPLQQSQYAEVEKRYPIVPPPADYNIYSEEVASGRFSREPFNFPSYSRGSSSSSSTGGVIGDVGKINGSAYAYNVSDERIGSMYCSSSNESQLRPNRSESVATRSNDFHMQPSVPPPANLLVDSNSADTVSVERRHIFIDYSNVSIGVKSQGGGINIATLASILKKDNSHAISGALIVAGSNASEHSPSPVWKIWESAGFKVKVLPRHTTNKEDGVDEFLHAQALNSILKSKSDEDVPGFNTLVLVTGDGNSNSGWSTFLDVAKGAIDSAWRVEVWSWRCALSQNFVALATRSYGACKIFYLDDFEQQLRLRHADGGAGHHANKKQKVAPSSISRRSATLPIAARVPLRRTAVPSIPMRASCELIDLTADDPPPAASIAAAAADSADNFPKRQRTLLQEPNKQSPVQNKKASAVQRQPQLPAAKAAKASSSKTKKSVAIGGGKHLAQQNTVVLIDLTEELEVADKSTAQTTTQPGITASMSMEGNSTELDICDAYRWTDDDDSQSSS